MIDIKTLFVLQDTIKSNNSGLIIKTHYKVIGLCDNYFHIQLQYKWGTVFLIR